MAVTAPPVPTRTPDRLVAGPLDRAVTFLWVGIPALSRRCSLLLAAALADGLYLSAWPPVALLAPPLALLLGFILGWQHFAPPDLQKNYEALVTYTYSIWLIGAMLAVASFGAALGFWLWLGFVIGDFFFFPHIFYSGDYLNPIDNFLHIRLPLLIPYVLLALLLVLIPVTVLGLRRSTIPHVRLPRLLRFLLDLVLQAALTGSFVYIWTESVPTLIRPIYTWNRNGTPPVEAMRPLQVSGNILVGLAIALAVVRILLEYLATSRPPVRQRMLQLQAALQRSKPMLAIAIPFWLTIPITTVFLVFMLSGTLDSWLEAIILFVALTLLMLLRQLIATHIGFYTRIVTLVPLLIRLVIGGVADYLIARQIVGTLWQTTQSFQPIIISAVISLIVFLLLLPDRIVPAKPKPAATGR